MKYIALLTLILFATCQVASAEEGESKWITVKIEDSGGRVSWYKGESHNLVAFDAITDPIRMNTDVFTMKPDGSGKINITSGTQIPVGFIGQPAWHPDGEHLVIQAESEHSAHRFLNHMAWGINNDLWVVKREGGQAQRIRSTLPNHAVLHPHFNRKGDKIVFAERIPTGKSYRWIERLNLGLGGENQWDGWHIHIADFDISKSGTDMMTKHIILSPNGSGIYETHGFTGDGRIVYSYTSGGLPYVDDIYTCDPDGKNVKKVINSPSTWDEHGRFSPSGSSMAFISSRHDKSWRAPKSRAKTLTTELYLLNVAAGSIVQLTDFNKDKNDSKRYLVSDFSWGKGGKQIIYQAVPIAKGQLTGTPELWLLKFKEPQ